MTYRFKAGGEIPSPQQPREQQSRLSAHPSRRRKDTERPHLTYSSLLDATRTELEATIFTIPENRLLINPHEPVIVAIASNNTVKNGKIETLLAPHLVTTHRVAEAGEDHTCRTIDDALSKAVDAARIIQESEDGFRREMRTRAHVTLANDVLNAVPVIQTTAKGKKEIVFERLGKPSNVKNIDGATPSMEEQTESVRQTFEGMSRLATEFGWHQVPYLAESATVIHNPKDPNNNAVSTQRSAIFLSREGLAFLASPKGFDQYKRALLERGFDITKIAGGLELDILDKMGLVTYITGTSSDLTEGAFTPQRVEARDHAYNIAMGHADERLITAYFGAQTS